MTAYPRDAGLPPPTDEALAHSRQLSGVIAAEIAAAGGVLPFSRYMELALYEPGLGYYSAGSEKFGAAGDFVTAPLTSPLFSRCLAHNCAQVLSDLGGGEILEVGGGTGVMAADILAALATVGRLPDRYRILEISADLKQRQAETLRGRPGALLDRVEWIDRLPDSPVAGVILGNEVMDALPCERFRIGQQGPVLLGVTRTEAGFDWVEYEADRASSGQVASIESDLGRQLPSGYESELFPRLSPWVRGMAKCLSRGLILLIDYGLPRSQFYHPQRSGGTLMCHYRHRAHPDPFLWPGLQDITAWVDFTAVAEAATDAGLTLEGFTTQACFLLASGIGEMVTQDATDRVRIEAAEQVRRLTLPGEMGERFKFIALGRGWSGRLPGLTLRDLSGSL